MAADAIRIPRVAHPPAIDEFITGEPLDAGLRIDGFRQNAPGGGQPVSLPTRAYLSHDDKNLYAVFVCDDNAPEIRARMTKRGSIGNDDAVGILIDTFYDRQRAHGFFTNPLGIQQDLLRTDGQNDDSSFDTIWHSRGRLTANGYVVWMAIPFKSLRFPNAESQRWGIAVSRRIVRRNEQSYWPYITTRQ